jgi:hypothetical protein
MILHLIIIIYFSKILKVNFKQNVVRFAFMQIRVYVCMYKVYFFYFKKFIHFHICERILESINFL